MTSASTTDSAVGVQNPYQGLRPFQPSDWRYFCGRKKHVAEIMQRLQGGRFVAVVGLSGSGKSSLVRAGVIPELLADRLKNTSSDWLVAMTTPGKNPLDRISEELGKSVKTYFAAREEEKQVNLRARDEVEAWVETLDEVINTDSNGLVTAIDTAGLQKRTRVLLVIDQFEELFRYTERDRKDAAEKFVEQLLNVSSTTHLTISKMQRIGGVVTATVKTASDSALFVGADILVVGATDSTFDGQFTVTALTRSGFETITWMQSGPDVPSQTLVGTISRRINVYVIITMRSEYMGDCARFEGLAEAVNVGLYLTPRLDRDQLEEAITVPAQKLGREIAPALVKRLLNDLANDQDQLPILQHALMRCWNAGAETIGEDEYEAIGGARALNKHAEELYEKLAKAADDPDGAKGKRNREIVEALFKRLTKLAIQEGISEGESDGRRDSATLDTISSQTGFEVAELRDVMDVFRKRDCAFLTPGEDEVPLRGDPRGSKPMLSGGSMIDITHESLIRKWERLGDPDNGWVQEEAKSADAFKQLVKVSAGSDKNEKQILSHEGVDQYKNFEARWNAKWARRYSTEYERAIGYLRRSKAFYEAEDKEKLRRALGAAREAAIRVSLAVALVVTLILAFLFAYSWLLARTQKLAYQAIMHENDNPGLSVGLALKSIHGMWIKKPLPVSEDALASALAKARVLPLSAGPVKAVSISGDLRHVAVVDALGNIVVNEAVEQPNIFLDATSIPVKPQEIKPGCQSQPAVPVTSLSGDAKASPPSLLEATWLQPLATFYAAHVALDPIAFLLSGDDYSALSSPTPVLSYDGRFLAFTQSGDEQDVVLWDTQSVQEENCERVLRGTTKVLSLAFSSPEQGLLAVGGYDGTVKVWNMSKPQPPWEILDTGKEKGAVVAIAFSPNANRLAVATTSDGASGKVSLWDVHNNANLGVLEGVNAVVSSMIFSHDGELLATAENSSSVQQRLPPVEEKSIKVWYADSRKLRNNLLLRSGSFKAVSFSSDGKMLGAASQNGAASFIKVWNIETADSDRADADNPVYAGVLRMEVISGIAMNEHGRQLLTVSNSGTLAKHLLFLEDQIKQATQLMKVFTPDLCKKYTNEPDCNDL